jgi:hypothetical protein
MTQPKRMHNEFGGAMATMTLKNVPPELLDTLKREAARNRRSLNQEALMRLESSLAPAGPPAQDKVEIIRRIQRRLRGMKPVDEAFIARAKRLGRP